MSTRAIKLHVLSSDRLKTVSSWRRWSSSIDRFQEPPLLIPSFGSYKGVRNVCELSIAINAAPPLQHHHPFKAAGLLQVESSDPRIVARRESYIRSTAAINRFQSDNGQQAVKCAEQEQEQEQGAARALVTQRTHCWKNTDFCSIFTTVCFLY
jgi:hypothetical protein